jgi:ATP-dependent protease ClpP protease subunit
MYIVFAGDTDEESLQRIFRGLAPAVKARARVHLLFQCNGGIAGHGIALYNFFRTLPIDLVLYNSGIISSMGVIAYLGGKKRIVSKHATFMVHHIFMHELPQVPAAVVKSLGEAMVMDDNRVKAILREHVTLSPERWAEFEHRNLNFTADDAVACGIANEVGDFTPPLGGPLYSL